MFQIEKVSGFELFVLYSYPMRSAFVFVFGLKCGKRRHLDSISSVSDPNPFLPVVTIATVPPISTLENSEAYFYRSIQVSGMMLVCYDKDLLVERKGDQAYMD